MKAEQPPSTDTGRKGTTMWDDEDEDRFIITDEFSSDSLKLMDEMGI
jgi:hypothetical protein